MLTPIFYNIMMILKIHVLPHIFFYNIEFITWTQNKFTSEAIFYAWYLIVFTLPVEHSPTMRLSLVSTHTLYGLCRWQLSMKRRNCPSLSRMWMQSLFWSAVKILHWLSVVIPRGLNDFSVAGRRPLYVNRCFPIWLTTTTAWASLSDTHISRLWFSQMYLEWKNE